MSDYIPEEIQAQILQWLPLKSLLRFRCVCRWWNQLIDSPSFLQHHLALQNPRFLLQIAHLDFLVLDSRTLPSLSTLPRPTEDRSHLLGTVHGIVCLYDHDEGLVSLWNPSNRKLSTLPPTTFMHSEWERDDGAGTTYSAFWIDPSTKDFKVVLFKLMFDHDVVNDGVIYSSIKGHWTELPLGEVGNLQPLRECPAIVIKGVAYWRACYYVIVDDQGKVGMDVVVLSFDFVRERFEIIEAPSVDYTDWCSPVLCNWQATLSLMYMDVNNSCDIYTRQEGIWVNMFCINLPSHIRSSYWVLGEMQDNSRVLVEERQESNKILASTEDELVLCDTRDDYILVNSGLPENFNFFMANDFVESLLFP